MISLKPVNILLCVIAVILLFNLVGVKTIGNFALSLDSAEPKCVFQLDNEFADISDINECCFLLQEQLGCSQSETSSADFICKTSDSGPKYIVNQKTISYCEHEGYTIRKE